MTTENASIIIRREYVSQNLSFVSNSSRFLTKIQRNDLYEKEMELEKIFNECEKIQKKLEQFAYKIKSKYLELC